MESTKLPSGFTLHTFDTPPANFDFCKATDRERSVYGLPAAAAVPVDLEERWLRKLNKVQFIRPQFSPRDRKRLLPTLQGRVHGPETSHIWSGGIVFAVSGDPVRWVEGSWVMPNVELPANVKSAVTYTASIWVGIDGFGTPDLLQAGCDCDIELSGRAINRQFRPWWEWYPAGTFWIDNMAVSPGDELSCLICVAVGSTSTASMYLINNLTQTLLTFSVSAPPGIFLTGKCAEWIVEALTTDGHPELARYSNVIFTDCAGGTTSSKGINAGGGTTISMLSATNVEISAGEILAPQVVEVSYVG